jgi:hypothetical protein
MIKLHRRTWTWLIGTTILLLTLTSGVIWLYWLANPRFTPDPKLRDIPLSHQVKHLTNPDLETFWKSPSLLPHITGPIKKALQEIEQGQWPQHFDSSLKMTLRSLSYSIRKFEQNFLSSGCYPAPELSMDSLSNPTMPKHISLGLRLVILRIINNIQQHQLAESISQLLQIDQRIKSLLINCHLSLPNAMLWISNLRYLHQKFIFPLAHFEIQPTQVYALLEAINFWQNTPSFLLEALRKDYEIVHHLLFKQILPPYASIFLIPWYQPSDTKSYLDHWYRQFMFYVSIPQHQRSLWQVSELERYLDQIRDSNVLLAFFRSNAIGKLALAQILQPHRYRTLMAHWCQSKCLIAAHRKTWHPFLADLAKQQSDQLNNHTEPPEQSTTSQQTLQHILALFPPPSHSFLPQDLNKSATNQTVCAIPSNFQFKISLPRINGYAISTVPKHILAPPPIKTLKPEKPKDKTKTNRYKKHKTKTNRYKKHKTKTNRYKKHKTKTNRYK